MPNKQKQQADAILSFIYSCRDSPGNRRGCWLPYDLVLPPATVSNHHTRQTVCDQVPLFFSTGSDVTNAQETVAWSEPMVE